MLVRSFNNLTLDSSLYFINNEYTQLFGLIEQPLSSNLTQGLEFLSQSVSKKRKEVDAESTLAKRRKYYDLAKRIERGEALQKKNRVFTVFTESEEGFLLETIKTKGCAREVLEELSKNELRNKNYGILLHKCLELYKNGAISIDVFKLPQEPSPYENSLARWFYF